MTGQFGGNTVPCVLYAECLVKSELLYAGLHGSRACTSISKDFREDTGEEEEPGGGKERRREGEKVHGNSAQIGAPLDLSPRR